MSRVQPERRAKRKHGDGDDGDDGDDEWGGIVAATANSLHTITTGKSAICF